MAPLLRAEILKLRTTRTFFALAGVAAGLSVLVVTLSASLGTDFNHDDVHDLFSGDFTGYFVMILGVVGMAGEWRHRTITSTVLAAPDRLRLLAAKLLSYGVAGILLSLAITVTIMAVGTAILATRGETTLGVADLADVLWRNLIVAGLVGALGVCVGGLIRNQVVAIVGLLVFAFAVEPTLLGFVPSVGRFGPVVGAPSAVSGAAHDDDLLAPGIAILVMAGWIGLGFAATGFLLKRRDLV